MRGSRPKRKGFWYSKKVIALVLSIFVFFNSVLPVIAATFTPSLAKREGPGPFSAAPIVQGDPNNLSSLTDDVLSSSRGTQVSGNFYSNFDGTQGSVVLWFTPEFSYDALSGSADHYIWYISSNYFLSYEYDNDRYNLTVGGQAMTVSSNIAAGTTYNLVSRWDTQNIIQGSNYAGLSINDSHTFGITTQPTAASADPTIYLGTNGTTGASSAIIEGLTVYRRVLYDGTNGINAGNGDEVALIYNSGTGTDPTRVTGSWDVVFNLPTNSSTGALSTGTGEAWSHPSTSNLTYTSTTNTGGFMLNGTASDDSYRPVPGQIPLSTNGSSLSFTSSEDDYVEVNQATSINNLTTITLSAWIKPASFGESSAGRIIDKGTSAVNSSGWALFVSNIGGTCNSQSVSFYRNFNSAVSSGWWCSPANSIETGKWTHVAVTYDDSSTANDPTIFINGQSVTLTEALQPGGSADDDSSRNLYIGNRSDFGRAFDGIIDDVRVWNTIRTESEIAGDMYKELNGNEANLAAYWKLNDGSGQTTIDSTSNGNTGTLGTDPSNPAWGTSTPLPPKALNSSEKIFAGGYKYVSEAENQGIYIDKTVSAGDDWVVRAIANSDGTSVPKIELWDQTHNQPIATQSGTTTSTRTAPNNFIFTGEAPTDMTNLRVKLLNTASSGVTYWHQLEVLTNLVNNPSLEGTYAGTPPIPPNWTNINLDAGDTEAETTIVHSGLESLQFNATAASDELLSVNVTSTIGKYYGTGLFAYGDGTTAPGIRMAANPQWNFNNGIEGTVTYGSNAASWQHIPVVWRRASGAAQTFRIYAANSAVAYADDGYAYELNDVSLTANPASEANSTESTGLRVDGRDSYVETAQADQTTTSGYVSFDWTPRHSAANAVAFAETTSDDAYVLTLNGDADNYVRLYWDSANILNLDYSMGGVTDSDTWDATGVIDPNSTYLTALSYTGSGDMILSVDGTDRITLSSIPASFGVAPDDVYFGSNSSSSNQGDSVFDTIVYEPTPTPTTQVTPTPSGGESSGSGNTQDNGPTTCTDPAPSSTPTIFAATSTTTTATLFFAPASSPLTNYAVRFGSKPGEYIYGSLNIAGKDATSATIGYLFPNTIYYFQLQGRNNCTGGEWSQVYSIKTKGLTLSSFLPQQTLEIVDTAITSPVHDNIQTQEQILSASPTPTPTTSFIEEVIITVLDHQQQPVGGAKVTLHSDPKEGVTNENGEITFANVERGEHTLIVQSQNFTGEQKLSLTGDKDRYDVSITILPKTDYTGTIIGFIAGGVLVLILMTFINRRRKV